uniref:Uncharacterized protein n=1 Tax=Setaria italica TaxID=4555 RepID=K4AP39_SETIT
MHHRQAQLLPCFFIRSAWLSLYTVIMCGALQAAEHDGIFAWTHQPAATRQPNNLTSYHTLQLPNPDATAAT